MAESSIPVDVLNPGQVIASLGFLEAAEVLLGDAQGVFDWRDPTNVRFRLRAAGETSPVETVLSFLENAEAQAVLPPGGVQADEWKNSWGPPPRELPVEEGYPIVPPRSPATLACELIQGNRRLLLTSWGDERAMIGRDNFKLWAGAGGYPGAGLARDALALIRGRALAAREDPFALSAPQSSSFRLDWRRDYIPLEAGFSVNAHGQMTTAGFPLVELLASIGLTHARPRRGESKLQYRFAIAGRDASAPDLWLSPPLMRAALGGAPLPFPMRRFQMFLDWPGQENQARSITAVTEESIR